MSVWSALVSSGNKRASDIDGKTHLSEYTASKKIESAINFYQAQTELDYYKNKAGQFVTKSQNEQIQEIEKLFESINPDTSSDPVYILLDYLEHYNRSINKFEGAGQHAVVGYRLQKGDFTDLARYMMSETGRENELVERC